jgi:aminopeptidase N
LRAIFLLGDVRQPLNQPAWSFSTRQYGSTIYAKGSLTLLTAEQQIGDARFTAALRAYADNWRWRHPTTADLRAELTAAGQRLDPIFDGLVEGRSVVEYSLGEDLSPPLVERRGEVNLPVEVSLELADGSRRVERWDASGDSRRFGAAGEQVLAVVIDPAERLPVQLSRFDDGRSSRPDAAATSIAVVFQTLAQTLLLLFGAIG